MAWQPTPGFLQRISGTEEPGGLQSMGSQKSWIWLKQLSTWYVFQMSCSEVCLVLRYLVCLFCRKAGGLFPRIIVGKWNSAPFSGGGLKENVASGDLTRGGQDQNHWMLRKRQESASIAKLTRFRGHCNKGNCCGYWENKKKMCENTALSQNINDSH